MVDVKEALDLINRHSLVLEGIEQDLSISVGCILADHVYATINMPPFDQSAMDGYAIHFDEKDAVYKLKGEIQAGKTASNLQLDKKEAYRIFTGGMIPIGCTSVIAQEDVERYEDHVQIRGGAAGLNIRKEGEQYRKGDLLAKKGDVLTPGVIGFIASSGIERVNVVRKPKIHILLTGDELITRGEALESGKIYESNGVMLSSALKQFGFDTTINQVRDDLETTRESIREILKHSDLVLISGGISVGDHDHVRNALISNDVQEVFYKVRQKPGKPLFFGRKENKLVFALPGNPSSALTCFYVYVLPAIQRMMSRNSVFLEYDSFSLKQRYDKKGSFTNILRARIEGDSITILEHQSSAMLNAWAEANALIFIPALKNSCEVNEVFEALRIDRFYVI
jgi:molybdopterin molybdotransferase